MQIFKKTSFKFFVGSISFLAFIFLIAKIVGVKASGGVDDLIEAMGMISLSLIASSFFTLFVRPEVFKSWLHFLYWWVVPLLIVYSLSSASGGGFSGINPWQPLFPILLGLFVLSTPIYLYVKSKSE